MARELVSVDSHTPLGQTESKGKKEGTRGSEKKSWELQGN